MRVIRGHGVDIDADTDDNDTVLRLYQYVAAALWLLLYDSGMINTCVIASCISIFTSLYDLTVRLCFALITSWM